jgi:NAD(P)-dependent dehydrogenase (short-subunit alcohol dehydrogenase family)
MDMCRVLPRNEESMKEMQLRDKVTVITGAARGIGAAIVRRFAEEGSAVVINYRSRREQAEALKDLVEQQSGRAVVFRADITVVDEVRALMEFAVSSFGRLDILINNATASQ